MIGGIKERTSSSRNPPAAPTPGRSTGFPRAEHRSKKSAFMQSRQQQSEKSAERQSSLSDAPPKIASSSSASDFVLETSISPPQSNGTNDGDYSKQNTEKVEAMSEEQIEKERQEIFDRFGPGIAERLRRAREAQKRRASSEPDQLDPLSDVQATSQPTENLIPNPALDELRTTPISSRPPTPRSLKRLRFAEVKDSDIHVYESQPSSPKRQAIALPAPVDGDGDVTSLPPNFLSFMKMAPQDESSDTTSSPPDEEVEEGTPEDIRRRFFPTADPNEPSLEWMTAPKSASDDDRSAARFDLSGDPIPAELLDTLPSHLGLHHHAGQLAGYTIDDLLLLARSTVTAQRAAMLEVLAGVLKNLAARTTSKGVALSDHLLAKADEDQWRSKIIAVGVEGLSGRGMTAVRAVEVVWQGVVGWDRARFDTLGDDVEGVDFSYQEDSGEGTESSPKTKDPIAILPTSHLFAIIADEFTSESLPSHALLQLLQILRHLVSYSRVFARQALVAQGLLFQTIASFVISPSAEVASTGAASEAVRVLDAIAQSSREAATALIASGLPDKLLRFIILLPDTVSGSGIPSHSASRAMSVVSQTLRLYATLGKYGLYCHVAAATGEAFTALTRFLRRTAEDTDALSTPFVALQRSWLVLVETWFICAQDPHKTTPPHDIRWSQVTAWDWIEDILSLYRPWQSRGPDSSTNAVIDVTTSSLACSYWNALAAFLEGSSVNGIRYGEDEKKQVAEIVSPGFLDGLEKNILDSALASLEPLQDLAADPKANYYELFMSIRVVQAALRLLLALLPDSRVSADVASDISLPKLPEMPLRKIHDFSLALTAASCWKRVSDIAPYAYSIVFLRPFTSVLALQLRLVHAFKLGTPIDWVKDAFAVLHRLIPGDEDVASWIITTIISTTAPGTEMMESLRWNIPKEVWDRGGMAPVQPLLSVSILPKPERVIDPDADPDDEESLHPTSLTPSVLTPRAIASNTRVTYPSTTAIVKQDGAFGLPLTADWAFAPIDVLRRASSSGAFYSPVPIAEGGGSTEVVELSELDVVRATLLFIGLASKYSPAPFLPSHAHVVFGCMRVFMLEEGVKDADSSGEIFRDTFVGNAMLALITGAKSQQISSETSPAPSIDEASSRILGKSTPFYQFYTEFVELYGAISYGDPLFAALLLPPLAMSYPFDYRKLLWTDCADTVRNVRTEVTHPVILDPESFLWPIETEPQLLDAYLSALARTPGGLHGLRREIAVHHVAHNLWDDLRAREEPESASSRPVPPSSPTMSRAWAQRISLLMSGPHDIVRASQ
ncbi:hypothetical protein DL93DRAFT_265421 [Clavulina sp. PMI_390]|nr:hypothetical protein DL93DRAFT_265421 [Clavulina sp. PMI_390]